MLLLLGGYEGNECYAMPLFFALFFFSYYFLSQPDTLRQAADGFILPPPNRMIIVSRQNNMTTLAKVIDKICSSQLYDVEMLLREDQRANILK